MYNNMDNSSFVFRSMDDLESKLQRCTDCCDGDYMSFHCPLCPVTKYKPRKISKVKSHLYVHWKTRVKSKNGLFTVVCHMNHMNVQGRHFHCPTCGKIVKKKENIKCHVNKCVGHIDLYENQRNVVVEVGSTDLEHLEAGDHVYCSEQSNNAVKEKRETSLVKRTKKKCYECGRMVSARWMKYHMKIHNRKKDNDIDINRHHCTTLVDAHKGVFCSAINISGPHYPVHVIKKTSGINQESFCEHKSCIDLKETANRGGNQSFECSHVRSASFASHGKIINIKEESLCKMRAEHFITDTRYNDLKTLIETHKQQSPLIVTIPPAPGASDRYIFMSIYTRKQRYWSKTGRTIVSYDKEKNSFSCQCSKSRIYCQHKAIAKCCIYQEFPELFSSEMCSENETSVLDAPIEQEQDGTEDVLPNANPFKDCLNNNLHYIKTTKSIPENIIRDSEAIYNREEFQTKLELLPRETNCHRCNGKLKAEIVSKASKLVLINQIISGITVFVKVCPRCRTVYRYQEFDEGIHNYNNSLFVGLDVCNFLRCGLQNHVAIGRSLAMLQDMIGEKLNAMEIHRAYLHFESLVDHDYSFSCLLCGYHPSIIIWDTFRKATFRYAISDINIPSEEEVNDQVDVKTFWENIENCILNTGISKGQPKDLEIYPNYVSWGPWIGKKSRKGDTVYNTEYKKCAKAFDKTEEDIDEAMPEEMLIHLLMNEKVTAIRKICKEVGVKSDGSSMDMILRMREKSVARSVFDKAYEKVFGFSGGWAVGCCRHGIIYCIKNLLRCESPRDYVDMERSLKHRPTISISDVL